MKEKETKTKYDKPIVEVMNVRVEAGMMQSGNSSTTQSSANTSQLGNATWN